MAKTWRMLWTLQTPIDRWQENSSTGIPSTSSGPDVDTNAQRVLKHWGDNFGAGDSRSLVETERRFSMGGGSYACTRSAGIIGRGAQRLQL
jgi:hypothetical protein